MEQIDERRLAENEVIFRQINKDVDDFLHDIGVQHVLPALFYCECSDIHCTQRIELPAAEYEKIHKGSRNFIVVTGHESPEIEKVVERRDGYCIVEKFQKLPTADEAAYRLKEL